MYKLIAQEHLLKFDGVLDNGNYQFHKNMPLGKLIVVLQSDFSAMSVQNGSAYTEFYTNSYETQQKHYAENHRYSTSGIDYNSIYQDIFGTSSGTSSSPSKRRGGICKRCNGTGIDPVPGGGSSSWAAYYNNSGTVCPYCKRSNGHMHDRCASCNTPSR